MATLPAPNKLNGSKPARVAAYFLTVGVILGLFGCTSDAGTPASSVSSSASSSLLSEVQFEFNIVDMRTDHQFVGQLNTFHVRYQYANGLKGAAYSPAGGEVSGQTYPYFQDIRNKMITYIDDYPSKSDFYEVFLESTAHYLMAEYPQLTWIEINVEIPAFAEVSIARSARVRVDRT